MRLLFIVIAIFSVLPFQAQTPSPKINIDLTHFNIGGYIGPYRGRTETTNGPFNQGLAGFGQVYFPFQLSYGIVDTTRNNEYANKAILIRSAVILHLVDNGAIAYGGAMQLSFRTINQFYLEYQLGIVYLEAKEGASPDLYDGKNLHHFVSLSKPLNQYLTASFGFVHLSKGNFVSKTSNQDVLTIGIKWNM